MLSFIAPLVTLALLSPPAESNEEHLAILLDGVSEIGKPGIPGSICAFGENSFAVVQDADGSGIGQPVVAATTFGKCRVVIFGHNGYFSESVLKVADTGRLMVNAAYWAAGRDNLNPPSPRVGVVKSESLLAHFRERGLDAASVDLGRIDEVDVLFANVTSASGEERRVLTEAIRAGKGLVTMGIGWGWLQLNPGKDLHADYGPNRLLAPMGLVCTDSTTRATSEHGYTTAERPSPYTNAAHALDAFAAHDAGGRKLTDKEIAQVGATLSSAIHNIPADDQLFLPKLRDMVRERSVNVVPSIKQPLKQIDILARVVLTQQAHEAKTTPPEEIKAHPAAAEFPGSVPEDAPRVTRTLDVDTTVPRWHSTGLYAAPGELITIEVPQTAAGKGLKARIGCHKDRLFHKPSWNRVPEITRVFAIDSPETVAACAFGGPVFIEVPRGGDLGTIPVKISGAVEAPLFVLGETDLDEWRDVIRKRPAPWAELATGKVILSVRSEDIRDLDDPEALMRTWDRVMDACADLIARPRERESAERYVPDAQISAGYLHAGYPIMAQLAHSEKMVDNDYLLNAEKPAWGFYHEMGHNHQGRDWTFDGTGEVTCNLFSLYVIDTVCGGSPTDDGRVGRAARVKRLQEYFAIEDPAKRNKGPFTFLIMYVQLQEAFGWEAYRNVFAEYRTLPQGERPKNDDEKRDQWLVRFSRTVGRNLGPFFEAWDVSTSQAARDAIADLPVWMPDDFPPKAQ